MSKMAEINRTMKEEASACDKEIKKIEVELENLKFEKQFVKMRLKALYQKVLANEKEILSFGKPVTKVIHALWEIKETIVYEHFSKFIDHETVDYLLKVLLPTLNFPQPSQGLLG